eukprot:GFKZ01014565.1.p1 GENE.GFKZ01014565.1~~GFKZ01014565.1.p1  ORF type:complete len:321 (-),score=31.73 GFKZ01014565.1:297-1259(-)
MPAPISAPFALFLSLTLLLLPIASALPFPPPRFLTKKFATVNNQTMAYVEVGSGDPIVFLHGNPTSSFLWRNILPPLEPLGRLIAPDLIGMGDSSKLPPTQPDRYTFVQHSNFLYPLLEQLGVKENVTFVIHDWGSALGFLWAYYNRFNPNAVKAIVFMEAFVAPLDTLTPDLASFFNLLRSPAGEALVLEQNIFIEELLPSGMFRNLTDREFAEYRRPYLNPGEDRRPTLTWPRQVPIAGEPADVTALVQLYSDWMATAPFPKLWINADPGIFLVGEFRDLVRTWTQVTEVTVPGLHYIQEDSPDLISSAIAEWLPLQS